MNYTIRQLEKLGNNENDIKHIFKKTFKKSNAHYLIKDAKASDWFVAEDIKTKKTIGVVCVIDFNHGTHFMFNLAVDPSQQKRGIGAALFEHVKNTYSNLVWRVHSDKPEIVAFYEKRGGIIFDGIDNDSSQKIMEPDNKYVFMYTKTQISVNDFSTGVPLQNLV